MDRSASHSLLPSLTYAMIQRHMYARGSGAKWVCFVMGGSIDGNQ